MSCIIQTDYNLKTLCENLIDYFLSFDSYINDRDYIDYFIKYNQVDDEESLANYFLRDFQEFCFRFKVEEKNNNTKDFFDVIKSPDIINI